MLEAEVLIDVVAVGIVVVAVVAARIGDLDLLRSMSFSGIRFWQLRNGGWSGQRFH